MTTRTLAAVLTIGTLISGRAAAQGFNPNGER